MRVDVISSVARNLTQGARGKKFPRIYAFSILLSKPSSMTGARGELLILGNITGTALPGMAKLLHPFTTPHGRSRATLREMPAPWATSTTSFTSL